MKRRWPDRLGREDQKLWAQVARTAKPLPGRAVPTPPAEPPAESKPGKALAASMSSTPPNPPANPPRPRPLPQLAGLEKRLRRDVSRGIRAIEARIDLHGMRQAEAHNALLGFLHAAQHRGVKLALVITGKGGGPDARGEERGVLRRLVPHWLADPSLRRVVIGYEPASAGHGGDGALYVRIRKDRAHGA